MRENWPSVAYQSRLESVSTSSSGNAARMLAGHLRDAVKRRGAVLLGDLHRKRDRIDRLYNADGLIGLRGDLAVGGVDLDASLAAKRMTRLLNTQRPVTVFAFGTHSPVTR